MARTADTVQCATHGVQPEAFVCGHILSGLQHKTRVGFFTARDPGNPHPDAWCTECNTRLSTCGGEWVGDAAEQLNATILCSACYDIAKIFHRGGNPWS